jgi:alkylation response protein AidB-like acyl-CoA dehydrogenase
VVAWPEQYGGRGLDLVRWLIFEEEYYAAGAPPRVNQNGIYLLGPTLIEHGTEEQKARYLPAMAAGETIWAQGWSEPNAGSDMASIRTIARRDGDSYIVNGQKTWVSRGAFADAVFLLVRTDPESTRHRGLTFMVAPLDAEGVTVRPIRQLDGEAGFAEVFLNDVRIPVEDVIGEEGQGWAIAMATAGFERGLLLRSPGRFVATAQRLVELHGRVGGEVADRYRDDVVRAWMDAEAHRLYAYWTVARVEAGAQIGAEASLNKIFWSELDLRLHQTALRLLGDRAELVAGAPAAEEDGRWLAGQLFALAGPIYAGTNQIQRNIVADRVLRLPGKPA